MKKTGYNRIELTLNNAKRRENGNETKTFFKFGNLTKKREWS